MEFLSIQLVLKILTIKSLFQDGERRTEQNIGSVEILGEVTGAKEDFSELSEELVI